MDLPFSLDYTATEATLIFPSWSFSISIDGTTVTQYVKSFSISGDRGQAVTGSMVLIDHDGEIVEWVNQFKDLEPHDMSTGPEILISVTVGSASPTYPNFVLTGVSGDTEITVNFSDKTEFLNLDNQTIADILADEGDTDTAHDVIADLSALVPGVTIVPSFPDWDVRTFRMNEENLVSKIDEICQVTQSYRRFEDDTVYLERLGDNSDTWTISDRFHIPEGGFTLNKTTSGLHTYFEAYRLVPQPDALAPPYACTGPDCIGFVDIKFSRPAPYAIIEFITIRNGSITDGVFLDAAENPLTFSPTTTWTGGGGGGTIEAHGWRGTYAGDTLATPWVPHYVVQAIGGGSDIVETSGFKVTKAVSALETLYGRRPEYRNMVTDLILDETTMTNMLNALAIEVAWSVRQYSLNTPFVSSGLCGSEVTVTYYPLGISAESMRMQSFNHAWSGDSGWSCSYGLIAESTA